MARRRRLRSHAAMVPSKLAFSGRTLEARKIPLAQAAAQRLGEQLLDPSAAVQLGGVDVGRAELDGAADRRDGRPAVIVLELPGAMADHPDLVSGGTEGQGSHQGFTSSSAPLASR